MKTINLEQVTIQSQFWQFYQQLVTNETIPYQLQVMSDEIEVNVEAERKDDSLPTGKSHAIKNFEIAAGKFEGDHFGWVFQDSDVYKWLESVAYSLIYKKDQELEKSADDIISLIEMAQQEDGYLSTFFQIKHPELMYRQLYFSHELYCAGHLIEAGIAYDQATGKDKLLQIAIKFINHIKQHFGNEAEKIKGADGHQEIELALGKLYEYTGNQEYLTLADFFLDVRGKNPDFFAEEKAANLREGLLESGGKVDLIYLQADKQPINQHEARGHAVRMLYMATSMAKVARYTNNQKLEETCEAIWEDITNRKMYLTGGVGSTVHGEAFTSAYDLPLDTMYCETCASIALVYFAFEMHKIKPDESKYLEVLEQALYNGVLSGASIDGKQFFYVNPMEYHPQLSEGNPGKGHVKGERPDWLGCACCPPNFARTIMSIQQYIYTIDRNHLYINLFIGSEADIDGVKIKQVTDVPYGSETKISLSNVADKVIHIRKPTWGNDFRIETTTKFEETSEFYLLYSETSQIEVTVTFEQAVRYVKSNPKVPSSFKKTAVTKGPFVYCGEEVDNEENLHLYEIIEGSQVKEGTQNNLLNRTLSIIQPAKKEKLWASSSLYEVKMDNIREDKNLTLIPYHLWGNRGKNEMRVWFHSH